MSLYSSGHSTFLTLWIELEICTKRTIRTEATTLEQNLLIDQIRAKFGVVAFPASMIYHLPDFICEMVKGK